MRKAADHLATNDPVLAPVIKRAGLCTIVPHTDYYWELVDGIISQQLSVKAAAAIEKRFQELFKSEVPAPEQILKASYEELRGVGLSNAKANYVHDLAQHIVDGKLDLNNLDSMSNDAIVAELTKVKGIGEWTAHMFMMFAMGRLDILAVGDLGIKNGIKILYNLKYLPTPEQIIQLAEQNTWAPYESVACWYIWHAKDTI